jgi:hypothetical protein
MKITNNIGDQGAIKLLVVTIPTIGQIILSKGIQDEMVWIFIVVFNFNTEDVDLQNARYIAMTVYIYFFKEFFRWIN